MRQELHCAACGAPLASHHGFIDEASRTVVRDGRSATMTETEFALFLALYRARGRTLRYDFLLDEMEALGRDDPGINTLKVHMHRTRRHCEKLGIDILTVYSIGWRMPPFVLDFLREEVAHADA